MTTYVTYHIASTHALKYFDEESSAKRSCTAANKKKPGTVAWTTYEDYATNVVKKIVVKNLMTGTDVEINSNTPRCCDPSSEAYWSM